MYSLWSHLMLANFTLFWCVILMPAQLEWVVCYVREALGKEEQGTENLAGSVVATGAVGGVALGKAVGASGNVGGKGAAKVQMGASAALGSRRGPGAAGYGVFALEGRWVRFLDPVCPGKLDLVMGILLSGTEGSQSSGMWRVRGRRDLWLPKRNIGTFPTQPFRALRC